ncbi:FecR family protein [Pedobacter sp. MC2016-24]|uniref:FecR family protein n=1 Tax=Pedobacter sp. MC2016-24 TaxID=2780090 RepID=UPI001882F2F8|nr:FecR domain-containing protein [Pedobacter sp. MC2016-24]MBE9602877.1 FecR family protein [Pedobacter sp. MC2016-24]
MTREEYILLYEKCMQGECTQEEKKKLDEYQDEFSLDDVHWDEVRLGNEQQIIGGIYNRLQKSITDQHPEKMQWYKLPLAAAIALIAVGLGVYLYFNVSSDSTRLHTQVAARIVAGSNKAILTLSGGKQIALTDADNGELVTEGNTRITKTADGKIIYEPSIAQDSKAVVYNTVSTPKGGQFQVVLPDGSQIWLNAMSSITYPSSFSGKERLVQLKGEAYFEIAKNPEKPFKVDVAGQQKIEVLGTHFNVEAYIDDHEIKTTLLEGSVKLGARNKQIRLKPGQIAIDDLKTDLIVKQADLEEVMAWKNGLFVLNEVNLKDVMKKAARWYDVDVEYQGNIANKKLWGTVSRYKDINELLDNIAITSSLRYKIEGRRVILMK